jgi:outer membrane cobalamin receptor
VQRVQVRALGYAPVDTAVRGSSGDTIVLALRVVGVQLDSIVVTAHGVSKPRRYANTTRFDTFYERRATAIGGKYFTREDIEKSDASSVYDLIKKVPGTKIEPDQTGGAVVRFERCVGNANPLTGRATESAFDGTSKVVEVYVDGLKTGEPFLTLQNLKPENVEAMEVYQGVAQLPVDARGNGCAAIYIWTRYSVGSVLPAKH